MATTLRRRNVLTDDLGTVDEEPRSKFLKAVAETADFFPKPKEDFQRKQTTAGAVVSWICFSIITVLVLYELAAYVVGWNHYRSELSVDMGVAGRIPFNFDITFHAIPCHELSIDAMDASGGEENDVAHDLFKSPVDREGRLLFQGKYNYVERRLGPDGTPIGPEKYDPKRDPRSPDFCGRCYIAPNMHHHGYDREGGILDQHIGSTHKDSCCNTCESVMQMYDMHRIPRPHLNEVEQCITELSHANPGCNLRGNLLLRKVKGNFHFAPGTTISLGPFGNHIHSFGMEQMLRFNITHTINHFSIGDQKIQRFSKYGVEFPLDGFTYTVKKGLGHMKYFIQVVPVTYRNGPNPLDDPSVKEVPVPEMAFEYSAQFHHKEFSPMMGLAGQSPSLFFVFDFHPIQMTHVFERPPFHRFLVKLCPIIGGVFVMMGLMDRAVEALMRNEFVSGLLRKGQSLQA